MNEQSEPFTVTFGEAYNVFRSNSSVTPSPILFGTEGDTRTDASDNSIQELFFEPSHFAERVNNPTFNGVWPVIEEARLRRELDASFKKLKKIIKEAPERDNSLAFLDNLIWVHIK